MTKKHFKHCTEGFKAKASPSTFHLSAQRLPRTRQEKLFEELKNSGSIDVPEAYKQTHL